MAPLKIVVGITGGIAAYKAVSVVRGFVRDGHRVNVIATEAALRFVGRPTLEALSRNPVHVDLYDEVAEVKHVALGQEADVVVIAPATANSIAQIAGGLAPDLLGNTVLARRGPLVIAPAMHTEMWENAATQHNVSLLRERGVIVVGPDSGALTGQDVGPGRMSEPDDIIAATYLACAPKRDLSGIRILITGGGTHEPLDPVRFLGNRSSGHMASALARVALDRGAEVHVVGAHMEAQVPAVQSFTRVSTAREMHSAVMSALGTTDVLIMAAAVADFRPEVVSPGKIKKSDAGDALTIRLVRNPDILEDVLRLRKETGLRMSVVGFAAETAETQDALRDLAREKLRAKPCDLLVVNQVGDEVGFGERETSVLLLNAQGEVVDTVDGNKQSVARRILDGIHSLPLYSERG